MDWKDGLTAAVVVGLGYWGIKSITKDDEDLPDAVCIHCGSIEIAMGGGLCIDCGRHPFNYGRAITAKEDDGYSDNSNTVFDAESFNAIVGTLNNCPECNEPLGGVYLLDNAYGRQDRVQSCKCGWYEVEPSYGAESFSAEYIMVKCDSCGKEKEKNWDEGGHQLSRVSAFPSKRPAKGFRYCSPCDEHICDSCRTDGHKHFDRTGCESHDMISGRLARKWKKEIAERKAKKKAESFSADKFGIKWGPEDMPCPKCGETTLELTEDLGRSGYRGFKGRYFYTCTEQMQYGKIGCDSGSWEGSEVLEHALENLDTSQLIAIIMGLEDREEYVMDSVLNAAESFSAEKEDMYFVFADGTTMIEAYDDYNHTYLHWKIPYSEIRDYVNEWTDNLKSDQEWRLDPHDIAYAFASGKWKDDSQYEPHGFEWRTAIYEAVKSRIPDDGTWNRDLEEPMTKAEIRSFLTGIDEGYLSKRAESFNAEYPESVSCAWCNREFNPNRDKHFEYNGEFMHNECGFRCIYDYMCWGNYEGKIKRYDAETWTEDMVCLKCNNPFDGCSCERCPQCDEFWNDAWANCDDCHSCDDCCQESCPHLWDAESHAYSYAYNEGHSDSRKTGEYRPSLSTGSQEASFKRVLKQKGD